MFLKKIYLQNTQLRLFNCHLKELIHHFLYTLTIYQFYPCGKNVYIIFYIREKNKNKK